MAASMTTEHAAVETKTLADGTVLVLDSRGTAKLTCLAPGVLLYVCTGYLTASFYEPMVAVAQREMDRASQW
jgi:hypothetical protein